MTDTDQAKKDFFTLEAKEQSRYSDFKKKFRLYTRKLEYLPSAQYIYDRTECPATTGLSFDIKYKGSPTDEQYHVIRTIHKRIKEYNYGCGLIIMGTGKGKSHVAMQITTVLKSKTLIMCHNIQTLKEMTAKFKEYTNITPGVYFGEKKNIQDITITTHKSFIQDILDPEKNNLVGFDVIIYDECDYSLDKNMFQALAKSKANYLYGMTGTPSKEDLTTEDFEKIFGKRIICQTVEKYNIVPSEIFVYRYKSPYPYIYENWAEQKAQMFNNKDRRSYQINIVKEHIKGRNGSLILTDRVEEADLLYQELLKVGIKVAKITGETKGKDDKKTIEDIEKGEISVIIGTTGKVARGVDIPIIDTIFLFASVHFEGTIIQAVGRSLRKHPKKEKVTVIDFSDDECRNQRYQRVQAYKAEYNLSPSSIFIIKQPKNDTRSRLFLD